MLTSFSDFQKKLRKTLLPLFCLLTLEFVLCAFLFADVKVRLGLVFGFLVGYVNVWSMAFLIGKMLAGTDAKRAMLLAGLLLVKVLILFAFVAAAVLLWQWSVLGISAGYLSVLFVVVLGVGFGYKTPRQV